MPSLFVNNIFVLNIGVVIKSGFTNVCANKMNKIHSNVKL